MRALSAEAVNYTFVLHMFGNFDDVLREGLMYLNGIDMLGFAYVAEDAPRKGDAEYKHLEKFLEICNQVYGGRKFVFCCRESAPDLKQLVQRFSGIKCVVKDNVEMITDVVINKDVFGSILLSRYEPYRLTDEVVSREYYNGCPEMHYKPLIPPDFFKLFEPVHFMPTGELTCENDEVWNVLQDNVLLQMLRELRIHGYFQEDTTELEMKMDEIIDSLDKPGVYIAVKQLIKEGAYA